MIAKVSELLQELIVEERKKLDEFRLDHGPTIGKMYEGLTSDILDRAIPPRLNLRIVSGFIYNDSQIISGQLDCMLVSGKGIKIPYTDDYKWHISDVIAVLEVKKTLYTNELEDAFNHLREVKESYSKYMRNDKSHKKIDISPANNAFAQMTGVVAPTYDRIAEMPFDMQMIYHTLVMEQLSPIRVVLGYHGFKSEFAFRNALIKFLGKNLQVKGFGIASFPHLIISENYSMLKFNGQPYCPKLRKGRWDFYGSTNDNPVLLLLELIWTKLEQEYHVGGFWGEDLEVDNFHILLSAKAKETKDKAGWDYQWTNLTDEELRESMGKDPWEPTTVNVYQFGILNRLCNNEEITINDVEILEWLKKEGQNPKQVFSELIETGLVALDGDRIKLITKRCVCAIVPPDGQFVAAENSSGRFDRWFSKKILSKR